MENHNNQRAVYSLQKDEKHKPEKIKYFFQGLPISYEEFEKIKRDRNVYS
jgi:hypothetical protein